MKILMFVVSLLLLPGVVWAEVRVSKMFGSHMVLQRGMAVPVWGWADAGEKVTVSFAGNEVSAVADAAGRWKVHLPAMEASKQGRAMTIQAQNTIVFEDVLVGEVWVCSGQSNMQYGWGKESHPMFNWGEDAELAQLAKQVGDKPIRSYTVLPNASFQPLEDVNGSWSKGISGSAVAFGFSYYLQEALDVPVAVIVTCWGSSSIEGWMPMDMMEQLPHFDEMMRQFWASKPAVDRINAAIARGIGHGNVFVRKQPNLLYNAMLHPVIPYACRGFVWYQGESNADKWDLYDKSFPLWIQRLRKGWGREDLHFLTVMLPGYGTDNGRPEGNTWAWFREVQLRSLKLEHTGVINTIDLGDAKNIHPADKAPVARRLAAMARRDVYKQDVAARGPVFSRASVTGNQMTIEFTAAGFLKTTDGKPPEGFWLADKPGNWKPATATITTEGTRVVLVAEGITEPVACRYAFSGKPVVNLVDNAGLPVYPFRTDDWEK